MLTYSQNGKKNVKKDQVLDIFCKSDFLTVLHGLKQKMKTENEKVLFMIMIRNQGLR